MDIFEFNRTKPENYYDSSVEKTRKLCSTERGFDIRSVAKSNIYKSIRSLSDLQKFQKAICFHKFQLQHGAFDPKTKDIFVSPVSVITDTLRNNNLSEHRKTSIC